MELSEEARQAQREYFREWRKKNPDKVREKNRRYWENKKAKKENKTMAETNCSPSTSPSTCNYCKLFFGGTGCPKQFFDGNIIKFGPVEIDALLEIDEKGLLLYVCDEHGRQISIKRAKIKYCPMCGRKLSKDGSV